MTEKCFFSTGVDDSLTCSKYRNFDFNGFPEIDCELYPCLNFRFMLIDVKLNELKYLIKNLN